MNTLSKTVIGKKWQIYPALIISSFCLLLPAFYNHYPLFVSDVGTYISSGFQLEMPIERPITYGLLIRFFSLNGFSLWFVVIIQAYIVSWLIFKILKNVSNGRSYMLKSIFIVFVLSICTSLSWIVSEVQPDVFTSIAFLCIITILMGKEDKKTNVLLYILFFISVAVHLSHPTLMIITLLFLLIFSRLYIDKTGVRPRKKILILIILSFGSMLTMAVQFSKSSHVFFIGSLLQKGVLKKYLDDNCAVKSYKICTYKEVLPTGADEFWWSPGSPLYKIGEWQGTRHEFNDIIHSVLTSPKYLKLYIIATVKQAGQQAVTFNIGDGNVPFPPGTKINDVVSEYFPRDVYWLNDTKQNKLHLWLVLATPNKVFSIVIISTLLALGYVLVKWQRLSKEMRIVLFVCITGIFLNCLDCAAFGIVNGRFGCKMIWLIPFCVMVWLASQQHSIRRQVTMSEM